MHRVPRLPRNHCSVTSCPRTVSETGHFRMQLCRGMNRIALERQKFTRCEPPADVIDKVDVCVGDQATKFAV
eukprot:4656821-Alexandrium_andersonii.AAC.1